MSPIGDTKPFEITFETPIHSQSPGDQLKEWLISSPFQLIFNYNALMSSSTTQNLNGLVERPQPRFWHCSSCRTAVAIEARERHVCPAASLTINCPAPFSNSPVDQFFQLYPSFEYDHSLPPSESFNRLRRYQRWRRASPESDEAWNQYQKALKEEF